MSPGVVILNPCLVLSLNFMLITLSVVPLNLGALFESAYFTARYVRLVGQDVSPGKCVLLSTSKAVRHAMKLWGYFWGWGGFGKSS